MVQNGAGTKLSRRRCSVSFLEIPMKTLADAFEHTLQDVYFAEHSITKALPKVIGAVSNGDLKTALKDHLAGQGTDQDAGGGVQIDRQEGFWREVRRDR